MIGCLLHKDDFPTLINVHLIFFLFWLPRQTRLSSHWPPVGAPGLCFPPILHTCQVLSLDQVCLITSGINCAFQILCSTGGFKFFWLYCQCSFLGHIFPLMSLVLLTYKESVMSILVVTFLFTLIPRDKISILPLFFKAPIRRWLWRSQGKSSSVDEFCNHQIYCNSVAFLFLYYLVTFIRILYFYNLMGLSFLSTDQNFFFLFISYNAEYIRQTQMVLYL